MAFNIDSKVGAPKSTLNVSKTIKTKFVSSAGKYVDLFEQKIAEYTGAKYAVACVNGTSALQVSLRLAGVHPGNEVIVPTYTFIATAVAVLRVGAAPVFCDVEEDTFNIDCSSAERCITDRTRAIMPVHYGGRAVNFVGIDKVAEKHDLKVVEDACHGWWH